jgi:signal transduction histidine kinase
MAASVVAEVVGPSPDGLSQVAALLTAAFSVAAHAAQRPALLGLGAALLSVVLASGPSPDDLAFGWLLLGGAWGAGRLVRGARARAAELESLTAQLAREREENARLAVTLERTRIARELHDVVAHAVSVMVVQAGGVRGLLREDQAEERAALASVEATGRQAMGELRRMVGILRAPATGEELAPPPRLDHVEALVEQVRQAGLPVALTLRGDPRPLPPGLELSAYRVVQEALTNTLKHAGPAHAEVDVRYGDAALEVEVRDDGAGPHVNGRPAGHGLAGMRERVALFGGELDAGPGAERGFRVAARFPLRGAR